MARYVSGAEARRGGCAVFSINEVGTFIPQYDLATQSTS
jgi:hypothetical protein